MINIKKSQKKIDFCTIKFQKKILEILKHLDYKDFDIGIFLTTNQTIKKYNKKYRQKDQATDILSFPYHTQLKPGQRIIVQCSEDKNLGDIIISLPYVLLNKKNLEGTFEQRMDQLLVHGICHLLGHEHIKDDDFLKMDKQEQELLKIIKQLR